MPLKSMGMSQSFHFVRKCLRGRAHDTRFMQALKFGILLVNMLLDS